MRSELIAQWKRDEAAVFEGWDFSYIKDRWLEEEPGWDYRALAKELVGKSAAVLDVATGGGEVFSSLAPFPGRAVAVEGYRPNVAVARKRLGPLGVEVVGSDGISSQLRVHESTLIVTAHGLLTGLTQPTGLRYRGSLTTKSPQWDDLQPVRRLIGFRTLAFGNRFCCKQRFHNVIESSVM